MRAHYRKVKGSIPKNGGSHGFDPLNGFSCVKFLKSEAQLVSAVLAQRQTYMATVSAW
jgi:hypothetical protein